MNLSKILNKIASLRYYRISLTTRIKVFDLILFILILSTIIGIAYDLLFKLKSKLSSKNDDRIDWHDWELIKKDERRTGFGEHGAAVRLDSSPPKKYEDIIDTVGYNAYVSDKIALNRSLKDLRPPACKTEKYLPELPTVSVIIIFHNEHLGTLLRTCYSVWLRSPVKLLKEIILVDDASTMAGLSADVREHIGKHLPIVKYVKLDQRSGLIEARVIGAKMAQADVLVFLDSHCEAYHNWLPPLLDAMANDYRTVANPTIDIVDSQTFAQYRQAVKSDFAGRGGFDWNFDYKLLPLLPSSVENPSKPFENPVMAGGLFAIWAKFFNELGGYDDGLETYGGEQYELSFKVWQCHGRMVEAACSRVTHIYRSRKKPVNTHLDPHFDFIHRNYKRVAEVWMDEYKDYIYQRQPMVYLQIDAGDISAQKALRQRLQCKSFKWYMENVAYDIIPNYPLEEPSYAFGAIQSIGTDLCIDTMSRSGEVPLGLFSCAENISYPHPTQSFSLKLNYELRERFQKKCWSNNGPNGIWLVNCGELPSSDDQTWRYDLKKQWIINKKDGLCLDIEPNWHLTLNRCNQRNRNMKWEFGNINHTAYKLQYLNKDWDFTEE